MSLFIFTFTSWLPILLMILPLLLLLHVFPKKKPTRFPPSPPQLPIIGNLHQLGDFSYHTFWQLSKKYGPLMYLRLGSLPTLVISSSKLARDVMKTQDLDFCNRPLFVSYKKLSYNFLELIFTPYGEYYRDMRKIFNNELLSIKKVQSFGFIRADEVAQMIELISRSASSSTPVNLTELMLSLTSTIISRAAFGKSYRGGAKTNFHGVFEEAQALFAAFFYADYIPWLGWIDVVSGQRARLEKSFQDMDMFYNQVIDEHLDPERVKQEQEDLVDVLIRVQKDHHLTRDHIKALLMDIFIAGTDTGVATVVWAMTELIRKPSVMKKVQHKIRRIIGNRGKVEEDDLHQLNYFQLVVKEIFRMHPAAPMLVPRETTRQCRLDGYDVAPKTLVFINALAIGQEPETWENPGEFWPRRFTDSPIDYEGNGFQFIPFEGGWRICLGMHFGVVTVEISLANLLYSFNWELPSGMNKEDIDMSELPCITTHKKSPLFLVPIDYINLTNGKKD
ncbi:cytochrome P450 71A1-like isoform X2 [Magnolia sinica]|uniref:cytochrome P450 71A1-like isoform X2 n=1 Tax=Magnolia sinica TaxID=86752 RepID=UPI00265B0466|nr:cytochrome P450 71A1-like isoform X2 [Magnolia sinica]